MDRIPQAAPRADVRRHRPPHDPATTSSVRSISDGWWRGQNSVARRVDDYGTTTAFLAQLVVTLASGDVITFGTDGTWRSTPSHVARRRPHRRRSARPPAARPTGTHHGEWDAVHIARYGYDELCASPAPPVRRIEELRPASIRTLDRGRFVVDFGQNINGWARLRRLGPAGTEITLTYGEWLDRDGDVTQDHIEFAQSISLEQPVSFQTGRGHLRRRRRRGLRAATQHEGLPVPPCRGLRRNADRRRRHRDRRAHRFRAASARSHAPTIASTRSIASRSGASATTRATSRRTARRASARAGRAIGRSTSTPPPSCTTSAASP